MRHDIRHEIVQTAKALFNERGFNAVSTGDIADALGISKGNLTYYFKKKEEIVEAIISENAYTPPEAPKDLGELDSFFLRMQRVVQENAFYFWHHAQLSQLSPNIRDQQHQIYLSNTEKLLQAFRLLQSDGVIRGESFAGEYARVADTLLLSIIYWMPFRDLTQKGEAQASFRRHAWAVIHHLLTEKGRALLSDLSPV